MKKYHLSGFVSWNGGQDSDPIVEFNKDFEVTNKDAAVELARSIVAEYHEKYKDRFGYRMSAVLKEVTPVWKTNFVEAKSAQPEIPAKPAVEAHLTEELL